MMFGQGISWEGDLLTLGVDHGVLTKSGAHFSYNRTRLGMGRENAKAFLRDNPDIAQALNKELRGLLLEQPADAQANGSGHAQAAVAS